MFLLELLKQFGTQRVIPPPELDLVSCAGGEAAAVADAVEILSEVSTFPSRIILSEATVLFKKVDSFKLQ